MLDLETFRLRAESIFPKTSLDRKMIVLRQYESFLRRSGLQPNLESLNLWLDELLKRGLSSSTLSVYTYDVLSYFELMMHDIDERKLKLLKKRLPPRNVGEVDFLTDDEVARLIASTPSPIRRLIYALCYAYARRLGEVLALTKKDVDLEKDTITFTIMKKRREEKATYELEPWIKEMLLKYESILGKNRLFEITARAVEIGFKKDCSRAGIEARGRNLRPHILRHCLHPETRIAVPDGILPARLLFFRHSPVLSFDLNSMRIVKGEVTGRECHLAGKLLSVWAGGRELVCTPNHRVFALTEEGIKEVQAGDLKVGDYIAGVRRIFVEGARRILDPQLWRLIGYYTGDGNFHANAITLHEKDEKIVNYYIDLCLKLGFSTTKAREKARNSYRLYINSRALCSLIESLSLNVHSKRRRVPEILYAATDQEVSEFIAGFCDAEGDAGSNFIRFSNTNKELLKDVQMLLLRLGIQSSLEKKVGKVKLPQGRVIDRRIYALVVSGDMEDFLKRVPTLKRPKGEIGGRRRDVVNVAPIIRKIYERRLASGRRVSWKGSPKLYLKRYMKVNPTRETLRLLSEKLNDEPEAQLLRMLADAEDIVWLKVTRIERSGFPYADYKEVGVSNFLVYDFEVPHYHTLITDGIISHNSRITSLRNRGVPLDIVSKFVARHSRFDTTVQFYRGITEEEKVSIPRAEEIFKGAG